MRSSLIALVVAALVPTVAVAQSVGDTVFNRYMSPIGTLHTLRDGRYTAWVMTPQGLRILPKQHLYDANEIPLSQSIKKNDVVENYEKFLVQQSKILSVQLESHVKDHDPFFPIQPLHAAQIRFSRSITNQQQWCTRIEKVVDIVAPLLQGVPRFTVLTPKEHHAVMRRGVHEQMDPNPAPMRGHTVPYGNDIVLSAYDDESIIHELGHWKINCLLQLSARGETLRDRLGDIYNDMVRHMVVLSQNGHASEDVRVASQFSFAASMIKMQEEFKFHLDEALFALPVVQDLLKSVDGFRDDGLYSPFERKIIAEMIPGNFYLFNGKPFPLNAQLQRERDIMESHGFALPRSQSYDIVRTKKPTRTPLILEARSGGDYTAVFGSTGSRRRTIREWRKAVQRTFTIPSTLHTIVNGEFYTTKGSTGELGFGVAIPGVYANGRNGDRSARGIEITQDSIRMGSHTKAGTRYYQKRKRRVVVVGEDVSILLVHSSIPGVRRLHSQYPGAKFYVLDGGSSISPSARVCNVVFQMSFPDLPFPSSDLDGFITTSGVVRKAPGPHATVIGVVGNGIQYMWENEKYVQK